LEVLAHLQKPDPQSSKEPIPFFESRIENLKFQFSHMSKSTAVAPPSRRFNSDEALLLELSASFYGDISEESLKWIFLFPNKYTNHLKETVQRENYPKFIDYVRALKNEIDEVLLPRARSERPSDAGRSGIGRTPGRYDGQGNSAPGPGKGTQRGLRSDNAHIRCNLENWMPVRY
jgi:hypothetical protein